VRLDGLSALFVAVAAACAMAICVYSFGWLRDDPLRDNVAGSFNLFVGATLLVLVVDNVFWLFVALETLTLCSADLVRYSGRRGGPLEASLTAVRTYLIVSQIGLSCLLAGLLPVVVRHGTIDFGALSAAADRAVAGGEVENGGPAAVASFLLVLLGLAMRAGLVPFHFWVPVVHPQLPTNTHAMMSAVMLKLSVYLMIRLFLQGVIGPVVWWWGATLLLMASVTALVTVFYALISRDLKTALAYHSVENVGIILAGVGLALLLADPRFGQWPMAAAGAALALTASLFHTVNHALFKTLLFLGAGDIERRAGTIEMDELGGLLRRTPWTGATFLVGAVAIAGLPPLNGFISEWLTLQSLFSGSVAYHAGDLVTSVSLAAVLVSLVCLALAMALTSLAFLKIAGESLVGKPRHPVRDPAPSQPVRAVLGTLAGACLVLGVQPWLVVPWLKVAVAATGLRPSVLSATPSLLSIRLPSTGGRPYYTAAVPMLPLAMLCVIPAVLVVALRWAGWVRRPAWAGGREFEPGRMQFTGGAFSALVWDAVAQELDEGSPGIPLPTVFRVSRRRAVVERGNQLYNAVVRGTLMTCERLGARFAGGDVRSYLLSIFVAVVSVLTLLALVL
jgi:hydrogenase-4 component B